MRLIKRLVSLFRQEVPYHSNGTGTDDYVQWMSQVGSKFDGMTSGEWADACVKQFGNDEIDGHAMLLNKVELCLHAANWAPKETPNRLRYWIRKHEGKAA